MVYTQATASKKYCSYASQALNVSVKEKTLALLSKNTFNKITVKNCTERSDTDAAVLSI